MEQPADPTRANDFNRYRPLIFSIAYRMLGSAMEAEDIVQEVYLRYQAADAAQINSPKAFLSTIATRLCLNQLQAARTTREEYIGPWLPEPILTDFGSNSEEDQTELHESLSVAFLALMEQLTPLERAVFLLREVFDYDYPAVARILGKDEVSCRQMLSRARKHIAERRPRFNASPEAHRRILDQFIHAVSTGDLDGLMGILSKDVTLWADGGGKARGAITRPLHGPEAVGRFLVAVTRGAPPALEVELCEVNGELAAVIRTARTPIVVLFAGVADGEVCEIRAVGNPDKLNSLNGTVYSIRSTGPNDRSEDEGEVLQ